MIRRQCLVILSKTEMSEKRDLFPPCPLAPSQGVVYTGLAHCRAFESIRRGRSRASGRQKRKPSPEGSSSCVPMKTTRETNEPRIVRHFMLCVVGNIVWPRFDCLRRERERPAPVAAWPLLRSFVVDRAAVARRRTRCVVFKKKAGGAWPTTRFIASADSAWD
jgi:hypothetical protein